MAELILSELTRMGQGFCVIGLETQGAGYRSLRPLPARSYAWSLAWPHCRGEYLRFELSADAGSAPHVEDRKSSGWVHRIGQRTEAELVSALRAAEVAERLPELFGCEPSVNRFAAGAGWVHPQQATRSICGCDFRGIRFGWRLGRWRAELGLPSGDVLSGLPIVDHDWNNFLEAAAERAGPVNHEQRLRRFLNDPIARRLCESDMRFARLGLARPNPHQQCWIMLDSLFPLPRTEWLEALAPGQKRTSGK